MTTELSDQELIDWAIENKRVDILVEYKWGFKLSPGQCDIVRRIAFLENRKLSISAMTRYGKTQCVAFGIALIIDFGIPVNITFLGPTDEQAGILRQYMSDLILADKSLLSKAQIYVKGEERIGKEASRKRMTFTTGAKYTVFSGEGKANRLMGSGTDILVRDEACLINREAYTKSSRMLGDNPEESIEIELYNPWDTDNKAYDHTLDPEWKVIQIDWQQAVREGRTTQKFVDQQRKDLLPIEFTVLYDSKFPEQSNDSLIHLAWIRQAEDANFSLLDQEKKLLDDYNHIRKHKNDYTPQEYAAEIAKIEEELKKYENIISLDPAEAGLDETVMYWGIRYENLYEIVGSYSEPKSEPMMVVGKVVDRAERFMPKCIKGRINIDRIGIGSGPLSRLKEVIHVEKQLKHIRITGCHFGESPSESVKTKSKHHKKANIYLNKKAENYFRLADIMRDAMISIPKQHKIRTQLMHQKWERTSANKKHIIDPEDSPDWADAMVYFVWKDNSDLAFGFV